MKAKSLIPVILLMLTVGLSNCTNDCEPKFATCSETPPTNEICDAFFERWFFDKENNKCDQIAYSGCTQKGFDTKQECEKCKCK